MWSQICGKMLVDKVALTKSAKKKKHIKLYNLKAHFFLRLLFGHIMPFFYKLETTFSNQFSLKYIFFWFSIQSSTLSRNMRKLCVKLRNATI